MVGGQAEHMSSIISDSLSVHSQFEILTDLLDLGAFS